MSLQQEVDILRNIPLFAQIELSKLKLIAFTSDRMIFRPGEVLCHEGDEGDAAYIVIRGEAEVSIASPQGPYRISTLGPNDILGEIAILCDVPRTATVTARTELEALVISKDLFYRLIQEFPQIAIGLLRELAGRLDQTTARLREAVQLAGDI